ncbi:MAG: sialate O-acetylesterase [Dysgonamonadaceae bacterium]|nr:sialate O-acetylesterase [Dysgonamonadaceae bacterium]
MVCSWNPSDTLTAVPGKNSLWETTVRTPKASNKRYSIDFVCGNYSIAVSDIMTGEVWLASGQSNMEFAFRDYDRSALDVADEVANAANNELRFFRVEHDYSRFPLENQSGRWEVCTSESADKMSIIAYYFGKQIHQATGAPVGLIASYWGGSSVQAWMPGEVFCRDTVLKTLADKITPVNWCPTEPSALYNAMIFPFINYRIAGTIWYQGEANTEFPEDYGLLFGALIDGWRKVFGSDFPFYYVQIAPWNGYWQTSAALVREQQERCLAIPRTGMISVGDLVNDISDIHPRIKKEVGMRLVWSALAGHYGVTGLQTDFPAFESLRMAKGKAVVTVKSYGKLSCRGKEICGFQICGADRQFYPAAARVEKDGTITVSAKKVAQPVAVRYCFGEIIPNLFDANGLPLLPFRTDQF